MVSDTINRRYKFGFFLTLVAVGLCLLFDASLKQTAGALILGVSAALLLGGLSVRTLQIIGCLIILASGVAIVAVAISNWRDANEQAAHEYENAILDLKDAIASPEWSNFRPITSVKLDPLVSAFAALIRTKFPGAYDDLSDDELARKTLAKYPQYADLLPTGYGHDIQVKTSDGVTHHFPAGTAPEVIERTIRKYVSSIDPDFAKAPPDQQRAYLAHIIRDDQMPQAPIGSQPKGVGAQVGYNALARKFGGTSTPPTSTAPKESGPWEKYASLNGTKIVKMPETTKKWEKRFPILVANQKKDFIATEKNTFPTNTVADMQSDAAGRFMVVSKIPFLSDESDSDILRYFQTEVLRPRPVFSLRAALRAEIRPVSIGLTLFVAGAFGCIWLAWARPRNREQ